MAILNFIIAVVALIVAIAAYRKAGGDTVSLKTQVNALREKTAEALEKAEKTIRPGEKEGEQQGTIE